MARMRQYGGQRLRTVECKGIGHQHMTFTSTKSGRAKARREGRKEEQRWQHGPEGARCSD